MTYSVPLDPAKTYNAKVDSAGRLILPAELRRRHAIKPGDTVTIQDQPLGMNVLSLEDGIKLAQEICRPFKREGVSALDELFAERRREFEMEEREIAEYQNRE